MTELMETEETIDRSFDVSQKDITARRRLIISRIEDIIREIIASIARKEKPCLHYDDGKNSGWSSSTNSSESETMGRLKTMQFSGNKTRQRFALIMRVMSHVHANLVKNLTKTENDFFCTKRAFFYSLKNEDIKRFVKKPEQLEWAIKEVTMLLECGPWEIGFLSTSKGLVAGDLTLHLDESRVINYEQLNCQAVPDVVANVTLIRTNAEFVLVVEKDSVFQKLLREGCPASNRCILVTGKGYPDIPTRMFVRMLSERAQLPVYALVDANPHGFEIMCVYRFGTLNNLGYREQLLCPGMRWLGPHYTDLIHLEIPRIKLTPRDLKKIQDLQNRSYVDVDFSKHLELMRLGKAEIESLNTPIKRFLTEFFIPRKIRRQEYY